MPLRSNELPVSGHSRRLRIGNLRGITVALVFGYFGLLRAVAGEVGIDESRVVAENNGSTQPLRRSSTPVFLRALPDKELIETLPTPPEATAAPKTGATDQSNMKDRGSALPLRQPPGVEPPKSPLQPVPPWEEEPVVTPLQVPNGFSGPSSVATRE